MREKIVLFSRKLNLFFTALCAVVTLNLSEAIRIFDYMKKEGLIDKLKHD